MSWRTRLFQEFTPSLAAVTRLTIAVDPDGLLTEQGILDALRAAGFEVIPFDDPVVFRFQYEHQFRDAWDRGARASAVILLRTAHQETSLPYDLLQAAQRENRILRFSLAEMFPMLAPVVLRAIEPRWFDAISQAVEKQQPEPLGESRTREFLLRHVFGVYPERIQAPAHLLRLLLERHYKRLTLPTVIDEALIAYLRAHKAWASWPLEQIVPHRDVFWTFLQERWPRFLARLAAPAHQPLDSHVASPSLGYGLKIEGPLDLPFEDDDVRLYMDHLFTEGALSPTPAPDHLPSGWWSCGVAQPDPATIAEQRWTRLSASIASTLPLPDADRGDWLAFAARFAEWRCLGWQLGGKLTLPEAASLYDKAQAQFAAWMATHFAGLSNQPYWPSPVMVHHIPHFLGMAIRRKVIQKCALVVVDGLSFDQWVVIKQILDIQHSGALSTEERAIFAWVPTLTSVSRQAIFSGKAPFLFASSIGTTSKEKPHWEAFWAENGLSGPAVSYVNHRKTSWESFLSDVRAAAEHHKCRALGIVVNTVDRTMHGMEHGSAGMQTMLRHWAHTGELSALLNLLFENGFDVWITADHGNTEARGIGKPNLGLSAEERGERVLVFQTAAQRENIARQYPQTTLWNGAGLPPDYQPILAANRAAFVYQDTTVVGHGGASIEEVLVPFIRVKKRR